MAEMLAEQASSGQSAGRLKRLILRLKNSEESAHEVDEMVAKLERMLQANKSLEQLILVVRFRNHIHENQGSGCSRSAAKI